MSIAQYNYYGQLVAFIDERKPIPIARTSSPDRPSARGEPVGDCPPLVADRRPSKDAA